MDNFFGIGMPELILILIIAGVVMGPERIGHIARWLGRTTAQLQMISRSFMRQLSNELDGVDDGHALREAMDEVQALRQELQSLRSEFTSVTNSATTEGKAALDEIEHSIKPPTLTPVAAEKKNGEDTAVAANGPAKTPASELPKPLKISDDPE